jgi:hypothetical protein
MTSLTNHHQRRPEASRLRAHDVSRLTEWDGVVPVRCECGPCNEDLLPSDLVWSGLVRQTATQRSDTFVRTVAGPSITIVSPEESETESPNVGSRMSMRQGPTYGRGFEKRLREKAVSVPPVPPAWTLLM